MPSFARSWDAFGGDGWDAFFCQVVSRKRVIRYIPQKSPMINDPFAERDHVGVQGCIGTKLHHTKMAEMHEMPYLYRSFSAKEQKMSFPAKEQKIYK